MIRKIRKMKHGPAALALMGGALVGLGMHNAQNDDLQANLFDSEQEVLQIAEEILEEAPKAAKNSENSEKSGEVSGGPIPSKVMAELKNSGIDSLMGVQDFGLEETETLGMFEKKSASDDLLPSALKEKLQSVRAQYETEYARIKQAQMKIDEIENQLVQQKIDSDFVLDFKLVASVLGELEIEETEEKTEEEQEEKTEESLVPEFLPFEETVNFIDNVPRG